MYDVDDKSLGVATSIIAIIGLVVSHIVQVFRSGRKQGKLEGKLEEHDSAIGAQGERLDHYVQRLETMQNEFDEKLGVWFNKIDSRIESIESQFVTSNGEQRFVSHTQHEVMQQTCQLHVLSEIGHVNTSLLAVNKDVNILTEKIEGLTASVAVLSDRKAD